MANLALSGLASGVDTSSIVDQLMAIERQALTRLQLKTSRINARDAGLKDVQAKLSALKSATEALGASSLYATKQVAESSSPLLVSASVATGAPIGTTAIIVTRLASSTQRTFAYTPNASAQTITIDSDKTGVGPVTVGVAAGASLADVVAEINGRSDLPVFAAAVKDAAGVESLVLSSRTAGPATAGDNSSGFTVTSTGKAGGGTSNLLAENKGVYKPGTTAALTVGGISRESDTNVAENILPGVTLTLKGLTPTGSPAYVTVGSPAADKDAVKAKLKGFIEAYNAVVNATRSKLTEKTVPDASVRADAVKGQLFGDTGLASLLDGMRSAAGAVFAGMPGGTDALADLGITTGAIGTGRAATGALVLDEAKLDAALAANFSGVRDLLAGRKANGSVTAADGIAQRFSALVDRQIGSSGSIDLRLKSSDGERRRIDEAATRTETRLEQREKRLRAQFAAMESALLASQTQQSWLSGQLAALNRSA